MGDMAERVARTVKRRRLELNLSMDVATIALNSEPTREEIAEAKFWVAAIDETRTKKSPVIKGR